MFRKLSNINQPQELLTGSVSRQRDSTDTINKYIGDDTKAAARQSPYCIKKTKNKIRRKTIFSMADEILSACNAARSAETPLETP